MAFETVQSST